MSGITTFLSSLFYTFVFNYINIFHFVNKKQMCRAVGPEEQDWKPLTYMPTWGEILSWDNEFKFQSMNLKS